jgi:hypothetical protein
VLTLREPYITEVREREFRLDTLTAITGGTSRSLARLLRPCDVTMHVFSMVENICTAILQRLCEFPLVWVPAPHPEWNMAEAMRWRALRSLLQRL